MILIDEATVQQALRSLKELAPDDSDHAPALQGQRMRQEKAIKALRGALAAPQQEPFGYFRALPFGWTDCAERDEGAVALYEGPTQPAKGAA